MKRTQLAAAVLLASGSFSAAAATYSVTPLPVNDKAKYTFGYSIDNSGFVLATTQLEYNPPVNIELVEAGGFFDRSDVSLENREDTMEGVFTDSDYTTVVNFLLNNRGSGRTQQLASYRSYIMDTADVELVPGYDEVTDMFDGYTHSVVTVARDSLAGDYLVGTSEGLFKTLEYTNESDTTVLYTYSDMVQQAFVQVNGETKRLAPTDTLLGGTSHAYAINQNLQVAGYGSASYSENLQPLIDDCYDDEERADEPVEYCLRRVKATRNFLFPILNTHIWQLDAAGEVISTQVYPLLFEPEEDDDVGYFTRAFDINAQGIAVGDAATGERVRVQRPNSTGASNEDEVVAVTFFDGETTEFLPREENLKSNAVAINDNNWVTGSVLRAVSTVARDRLFVYNLDTEEARYPQGFFNNAAVFPSAINNNNIVVGRSEFEATTDGVRETRAFMYDLETDTLTNLNTLIGCDSPYTLVDAVAINDDNEIVVNARVSQNATYITGNEIVNDEGEASEVDNIVALRMTPIANGEIEDCAVESQEEEKYERKGAAINVLWLGLLGLAIGFRRRLR
ncbi:DUF3466 family protein [Alteromonas antoniana]|uniref:DUF3466 family protein n=1 Tax=Alteromonas antoniana TaxID=2803813 RepID=UPI001C44E657|nr:DUF3466 family protein [Alteromonas antoniana]